MKNSSESSQRIQLILDIPFKKPYSRNEERGVIKNISLTGAFLEVQDGSLKVSDKIHIQFNVADRVRKIACQIIWKNPSGCGVKFLPNNNRDVQLIDDLIYFTQNDREGQRQVLDLIFKTAG